MKCLSVKVDVHSKNQRSFNMAAIKSANTKPELAIRKALFGRGFRYRLHKKDLPGKPDIVFPKLRAVIFVNGCFWHYHNCSLFKIPDTRHIWWQEKLQLNKKRDEKNVEMLLNSGWRVMIVWECALRGNNKILFNQLIEKISNWLKSDKKLGLFI